MCLTQINQTGLSLAGIGYKIYDLTKEGKLNWFLSKDLELDKWYDSSRVKIKSDTGLGTVKQLYDSGFHILEKLEDVEAYKNCFVSLNTIVGCIETGIFEVEYKGGHTRGEERAKMKDFSTIVAHQMLIKRRLK